MPLSNDLISQFAKATKDTSTEKKAKTVYGTVRIINGEKYVKIDGSELLTPVVSTTNGNDEDRVTVTIKNHSAIVMGNITSPSATGSEVQEVKDYAEGEVERFDKIVADKVDTEKLNAEIGRINTLVSDNVTIKETLSANEASIKTLQADNVTINGKLDAHTGYFDELNAENATITGKLDAVEGDIQYLKSGKADITELNAIEATITKLEAKDVDITGQLTAVNADIENLEAKKLSADEAEIKYANIDFANIGKAAMEYLYAQSGLIKDVVIDNGSITGYLVGVTIKGDLIEGNTIVAEKLIIQGEDGLYYKLNTDGKNITGEQTDYNSINGSIIAAKSITAGKISVDDLVAFGADIGGFKITSKGIHSSVKESVDNTTEGIYLGNDGQIAFGDANNYVKFFKDTDETYKLDITASTIKLGSNNKNLEQELEDLKQVNADIVIGVDVEYYLSESNVTTIGGTWDTVAPVWEDGKYMWSRIKTTLGTGATTYSKETCISGARGPSGEDGLSIKEITNYYLTSTESSGITRSTDGWTTTVQVMDSVHRYLWNYEVVIYADNTEEATDPCIIGVHGATGTEGIGIAHIYEKYAVSNDSSNHPTTWFDTVQKMTSTNKYLWNYETVEYTNGNSVDSDPRIIGVYGDTGSTGNGISSVVEWYYLSTSKNALVGGSWSMTPPTWSSGKYIWYKSQIIYTNGSDEYTTAYCDSAWEAVNEIEVGAKNLLRYTDAFTYFDLWKPWDSATMTTELTSDNFIKVSPSSTASACCVYPPYENDIESGEEYTLSFVAYADSVVTLDYFYILHSSGNTKLSASVPLTIAPKKYSFTFTASVSRSDASILFGYTTANGNTRTPFYIREVQLEKGNRATDWTPSPDDVTDAISDAVDGVRGDTETALNRVNDAQIEIDSLKAMISQLVVGENGESLMKQTDNGWQFSISSIQSALNSATTNLNTLDTNVTNVKNLVDNLNASMDDLGEYTNYITFGTDENNQPCIILGETDSVFKVIITNTAIRFVEGSSIPAYINNQSLHVEKAVISDELKQGGFAWVARSNGNYGLLWKGV